MAYNIQQKKLMESISDNTENIYLTLEKTFISNHYLTEFFREKTNIINYILDNYLKNHTTENDYPEKFLNLLFKNIESDSKFLNFSYEPFSIFFNNYKNNSNKNLTHIYKKFNLLYFNQESLDKIKENPKIIKNKIPNIYSLNEIYHLNLLTLLQHKDYNSILDLLSNVIDINKKEEKSLLNVKISDNLFKNFFENIITSYNEQLKIENPIAFEKIEKIFFKCFEIPNFNEQIISHYSSEKTLENITKKSVDNYYSYNRQQIKYKEGLNNFLLFALKKNSLAFDYLNQLDFNYAGKLIQYKINYFTKQKEREVFSSNYKNMHNENFHINIFEYMILNKDYEKILKFIKTFNQNTEFTNSFTEILSSPTLLFPHTSYESLNLYAYLFPNAKNTNTINHDLNIDKAFQSEYIKPFYNIIKNNISDIFKNMNAYEIHSFVLHAFKSNINIEDKNYFYLNFIEHLQTNNFQTQNETFSFHSFKNNSNLNYEYLLNTEQLYNSKNEANNFFEENKIILDRMIKTNSFNNLIYKLPIVENFNFFKQMIDLGLNLSETNLTPNELYSPHAKKERFITQNRKHTFVDIYHTLKYSYLERKKITTIPKEEQKIFRNITQYIIDSFFDKDLPLLKEQHNNTINNKENKDNKINFDYYQNMSHIINPSTPLLYAIKNADIDLFNQLTNKQIKDLSHFDYDFFSHLKFTDEKTYHQFVYRLFHLDFSFTNPNNKPFLQLISHSDDLSFIKEVIKKENIDLNLIVNNFKDITYYMNDKFYNVLKDNNINYQNPLIAKHLIHYPSKYLNLYIVNEGNITYKNEDNENLLHLAIQNKQFQNATILMESDKNLNLEINRQNKIPISYMLSNYSKLILEDDKLKHKYNYKPSEDFLRCKEIFNTFLNNLDFSTNKKSQKILIEQISKYQYSLELIHGDITERILYGKILQNSSSIIEKKEEDIETPIRRRKI